MRGANLVGAAAFSALGLFHSGDQWRQISIGNERSKLSSAPRRQPTHPSNTAGSFLYNDGSPLPNRWIDLSGATARPSLRTPSHTDRRPLSQQQYQQQVQPKDIKQELPSRALISSALNPVRPAAGSPCRPNSDESLLPLAAHRPAFRFLRSMRRRFSQ